MIVSIIRNQKIRFIVTGILNTSLDFLTVNILFLGAHLSILLSNSTSLIICMVFSFFMNHYFVFQSKKTITFRSIWLFFLTTGVTLLVAQNVIITVLLGLFSAYPLFSLPLSVIPIEQHITELNVAKLIAVLFSMVVNFVVYKYVIFKRKDSEQSGSDEPSNEENNDTDGGELK